MKKVILFNFNGTITNTKFLAIDMYNEIAEKQGYKKILEEDVSYLSALSIRNRCKVLNLPLYKMPLVGIAIKRRSQQYIPNLKPVSGIKETLRLLKQKGYKIGFTTSNNQVVMNEFLINNSINIFNYRHFSFSPLSKSKDISSFLKKYDLKKEDVVYVGDELRDIKAAKKNGLFCIAVSWGFDSVELLNTGRADKVITEPKEILDVLSRL
ncbi:HAD-IA family hydrolase [Priestia megaterium]|uniref:HAD-IA family hydrolase n=1 Tax=Priestia megaterium TaxID=1404 RepID=UPI000BF63F4B|nr:HAD-IA family hydrolase [Priestia megaterium]RCX27858.1 phosphoglycolate phosphatase [Bacillus sp. AG236]MCP1447805.1 phosphoglycolate phosphatase [Priestia megaterium]MEB2291929.1 HAD-IA family hydrolase [Priestia megaterium]MEE3894457.1 HAD-IA family hydrolase [Priestia megaterium]PEZ11340.1 haloacid dehalogenase [Priestia megaterium]